MDIRKGDIYYADLRPVVGSEQGGTRPVLIVQNNVGNRFSPTVIAAAITGSSKKAMPTHVYMGEQEGLPKVSTVMLEQIRTIDRGRLKEYIGSANAATMQYVDHAIAVSFGLDELLAQQEETEK